MYSIYRMYEGSTVNCLSYRLVKSGLQEGEARKIASSSRDGVHLVAVPHGTDMEAYCGR